MKTFARYHKLIHVPANDSVGGEISHEDIGHTYMTVTFLGLSSAQVQANVTIRVANFNIAKVAGYISETSEGSILVFPNPVAGGVSYGIKNPGSGAVTVTFMCANN